MADNPLPTDGSTVNEPVTTDAIARIELDETNIGPRNPPLSLEVDVPRGVVGEIEELVDETDNNSTVRDFLLEQVDIELQFVADGEPVDARRE